MRFEMPNTYPNGAPLYWMYEQTGRLKIAITNFLTNESSQEENEIVKEYLKHWINCPRWMDDGDNTLPKLRYDIKLAKSREDLHKILNVMGEMGIDPF